MNYKDKKIGFAITGSFCTISQVIPQIEKLVLNGGEVIPIMSDMVINNDTRFYKSEDLITKIEEITNHSIITKITQAEPIGPKSLLDALIIAPCTGNTMAKIATAMTDTTVAMAAKATLRNEKPVVIAMATNDGLGLSAKNIASLLNAHNIYMVPFWQDDPNNKPKSLVADMSLIESTLLNALLKEQIQPVIKEKNK